MGIHVVNKRLLLRAFLGYELPFTLFLTLGFGVFMVMGHQHNKELIAVNEGVQINLARKSLARDFEQVLPDINVLANERHVQRFLSRGDEASRQLMMAEFKSFAQQKRLYSTIRYLDLSGNELARVDYRDGIVRVVTSTKLQNKADRYYFKDSLGLNRGELYISPIDLNIEHGRIQIPRIPTIRFALAVYDESGVKHGLLVLNYNAEIMLRHFDEMLTRSAGHVSLLNDEGYWIRAHEKEREWGFMLGHDQTFAGTHPQVWQTIKSNDEGQILARDGMFSYTTIYPLKIIGGYSEQEVIDEQVGHHHVDPQSYWWKVVSDVPRSTLNANLKEKLLGVPGLTWLILLIAGSVTCWQFALVRVERRSLLSRVHLHAKLYETTTEGVLITDPAVKIVAVNEAFTTITGYSQDEVLGKSPSILSSGAHDRAFYSGLWSTLSKHGNWEGEVVNRRKDGGIYIEWLRISAIRDEKGNVANYVAIFSDITSRKLSEEELRRRAHHDPLTGLNNRLSFNERLDQNLARARRVGCRVALLYIDLDKFKPINDTYSHQAGDAVLREVAGRLLDAVRETDTVSRVGGDEFVVILAEIDTVEHAGRVAENILEKLLEPFEYEGHTLEVGASIGISVYPDDASDGKALLAMADAAMYRTKHQTRHNYRYAASDA